MYQNYNQKDEIPLNQSIHLAQLPKISINPNLKSTQNTFHILFPIVQLCIHSVHYLYHFSVIVLHTSKYIGGISRACGSVYRILSFSFHPITQSVNQNFVYIIETIFFSVLSQQCAALKVTNYQQHGTHVFPILYTLKSIYYIPTCYHTYTDSCTTSHAQGVIKITSNKQK